MTSQDVWNMSQFEHFSTGEVGVAEGFGAEKDASRNMGLFNFFFL
jgi:hypothetical protein